MRMRFSCRLFHYPEYLQGYAGSNASDIYSPGVIACEMLSGELPCGSKELTLRRLKQARYHSVVRINPDVPVWIDRALEKAVSIDHSRRYTLLSELAHDLAHPNPAFESRHAGPLIERNPLLLWKGIVLVLFLLNIVFL